MAHTIIIRYNFVSRYTRNQWCITIRIWLMRNDNRNIISGFSIGAGLKVKMFAIDVAVAGHHVGGTTLMLNLSTNLNEFKRR